MPKLGGNPCLEGTPQEFKCSAQPRAKAEWSKRCMEDLQIAPKPSVLLRKMYGALRLANTI